MDFALCNAYTSVAKPASGKLIYLGFLMMGTSLSLLAFLPGVRSFFIRHSVLCDRNLSLEKCDMVVGHLLLYRVHIGMFIFFVVIAVLNCQMSLFSVYTRIIENGLWFMKWNLFCFFVLISILLPEGRLCHNIMHIGWLAAVLVIFMEILLLIDASKHLNSFCIEKVVSSINSRTWYFLVIFVTSLLYTLSIGFTVYFYVVYSSLDGCRLHRIFVIIMVSLCVCASLLPVHPRIREAGLLPAGIVTSYAMYFAWSALSHSPDPNCNISHSLTQPRTHDRLDIQPVMLIDIVMLFGLLFYGVYRVYNLDEFFSDLYLMNCCDTREDNTVIQESREPNEEAILSSSYLSFYMCILLVILYILMVLSQYYTPEGILGTNGELLETRHGIIDMNEYTKEFSLLMMMSIKMTMCMMFVLLYIWSIIAPILFPW